MTSQDKRETSVKHFLGQWTRCVNSRELDGVLALYDESAVLVPTFSSRLLNSPDRIREYFATLCSRDELGIELHEKPRAVTAVRDDLCVVSGIYRWRFAIDDEPFTFEARFTFLLDLPRSSPILHHHSSQIPRML